MLLRLLLLLLLLLSCADTEKTRWGKEREKRKNVREGIKSRVSMLRSSCRLFSAEYLNSGNTITRVPIIYVIISLSNAATMKMQICLFYYNYKLQRNRRQYKAILTGELNYYVCKYFNTAVTTTFL